MTSISSYDRMALRSNIERNAIFSELYMDKELILLSAVEGDPEMSQRELAHKTGLSLGTINILLKKMVREGLIKLERLPPDRVAYMMTPKGIEEKVTKTKAYIQGHYTALERMRAQLIELLGEQRFKKKSVVLEIEQIELRELVMQVVTTLEIAVSLHPSEHLNNQITLSDCGPPVDAHDMGDWINLHDYIKL